MEENNTITPIARNGESDTITSITRDGERDCVEEDDWKFFQRQWRRYVC